MARSDAQRARAYRENRRAKAAAPKKPAVTLRDAPLRPDPVDPGPPSVVTIEVCEANVARLQRQAEAADRDDESSPADRATIGRALSTATEQLIRLRGEETLTEQRIIRSPAFARVLDAIDRAAAEHKGPWVRAIRQALGVDE